MSVHFALSVCTRRRRKEKAKNAVKGKEDVGLLRFGWCANWWTYKTMRRQRWCSEWGGWKWYSQLRTSDTHSAIWSSLLLCLDSAFAIEQRRTWTQLRCFNCSWSTCVSNWMAAGTDVRVSGSFMLAFALQREEKKRVLSEKLSYLSG